MKRILPLMVVLALGASTYGCSKKSSDNNGDDTTAQPGAAPGQTSEPGAAATAEELQTNPVEGVEPVSAVLDAGEFTDGPVWHAGMKVLFFSTPLGEGALYRMLVDGRVLKVRDGNKTLGTTPIGNAVSNGTLITVEAKQVVRAPAEGGDVTVIAQRWGAGGSAPAAPPPVPGVPAAPAANDGTFDTLNDVAARKDGMLYVTDPGYFTTPVSNRIYRIDPSGNVQVVEAFADVPRPNGIALSPDEKTLYIGFAAPVAGTVPFIRKYIVNDDGGLGEWTKFVDVGPDSDPDGLTVDKAGNVYVATAAGVTVFKADGKQWGVIPVPEKPTGLAFGGEDLKTLFITTGGTKIWRTQMKLAGIAR